MNDSNGSDEVKVNGSGSGEANEADAKPVAADPIAEAKMETEKFKNEYLYLRAEFENFKKQALRERSDIKKYGAERLAIDLLNVLDIFEHALSGDVNTDNISSFKKGIELTAAELRSALQRNGIEEVPSKGKPFDPAIHEALTSEETTEVNPGDITQVFKKPYKLYDRVIRPGQVVVAKAKAD
jgi:molecular chaperone GrpE